MPTLFILLAPPAAGFIAWVKLHNGVLDEVACILYYFVLLTTMPHSSQIKHFVKLTFALHWWAYSFPIAAMNIASTIMLEKVGGTFFAVLVPVLITLLLLLVSMLIIKTLLAMKRWLICVPE